MLDFIIHHKKKKKNIQGGIGKNIIMEIAF